LRIYKWRKITGKSSHRAQPEVHIKQFLLSEIIFTNAARILQFAYTVVHPYAWVIFFKACHGYVKPRIIQNAIYNVIFV
jgi:hypothetical protein